ncbi:MAG: S9 family peptidase, partial [Bacteroidota bacterium]
MKNLILLTYLLLLVPPLFAQELKQPSFEEVLSLQTVFSPVLSPDGQHVIYSRQTTDWEENRYDRELWLAKAGETPFQLTNTTKGNSGSARWSPDGKWITFLANRDGKNQLQVMRSAGGEAHQITNEATSIGNYAWSPDGTQIAFLRSEDKSKQQKARTKLYGEYSVDDEEFSLNQLWMMDFRPDLLQRNPLPGEAKDSTYKAKFAPQLLLDSVDFTVNSFLWSPDGKSIAFAHQPDPLINTFFKRDISVYDVATETHRSLVSNPSFDGLIDWSPDSKSLLYSSSLSDSTSNYYRNDRYFRIDLDGNNNQELGAGFDENLNGLQWTPAGIFGTAYQKTDRTVIQVNPQTGAVKLVPNNLLRTWSLSFSDDGQRVAYLGRGDKDLNEVYLADLSFTNPKKLTDASKQISQWATSNSEVISWKSQDGAVIEGVLHKPQDYDPE